MTGPVPDAADLIGTWPVGSPEWHAARLDGLGGSEIAAVLGISKWESRFSLWHRKAGRIPEQPENDEMRAGTLLEPVILAEWERKQAGALYLLNPGQPCGTWRNRQRPWQIASPDAFAVRRVDTPRGPDLHLVKGVEAKFALYDDDWGTEGTDEIPPYYLAQVRHYCDTLGLPEFDVGVFIGSSAEFRTYTVRADEADQEFVRGRAVEFLDTLPGRPNEQRPDIDAHSATYQAIRSLHPLIDDAKVELDPALARTYCTAKHAVKEAEQVAQQATSLVADALGNAKTATHLGTVLARRQVKAGGVPYVVAARNLPDFSKDTAA